MVKFIALILSLLSSPLALSEKVSVIQVKGKVHLERAGGKSLIQKGQHLKNKDLIITEQGSFARLSVFETIITLAPGSYYEVNTKKLGPRKVNTGKLIYGHLKAKFLNSEQYTEREISSSAASLGVRGTSILLHVTRDQKEYQERYRGMTHSIPSLEEIRKRLEDEELFTQICCIEGEVKAQTNANQEKVLSPGQVINFTGDGIGIKSFEFTPEAIQKTSEQFGLEF